MIARDVAFLLLFELIVIVLSVSVEVPLSQRRKADKFGLALILRAQFQLIIAGYV